MSIRIEHRILKYLENDEVKGPKPAGRPYRTHEFPEDISGLHTPAKCYADAYATSIEPQWLRKTKATPVSRWTSIGIGGMAFVDPAPTACTIACSAYFFPLPIALEGQGKEMSFSTKDLTERHREGPNAFLVLLRLRSRPVQDTLEGTALPVGCDEAHQPCEPP
ncbi:MAG: hypothetical protein A2Z25_00575 [Planctomycetes bacterium RBG_16_55_9]|nr:MAG: hypothetical protein A2Z25_00575 [Planctomycetes bacterium RBG_16_55_9]